MTESDLRGLFGVRSTECRVLLDQTLYDQRNALEDEATRVAEQAKDAGIEGRPDLLAIGEQIAALDDAIEASEVVIVVQSIGTRAWLALKAEHPPTRDQRLAGFDINPETFPPAAVAACTVEVRHPGDPTLQMTEEFAQMMFDLLPEREFERVWGPVLDLNMGSSGRPKSLIGSVARKLNGRSSTTASPAESPAPSFSDESPDQGSLAG